jgi:hypothetical protein
MFRTFLFILETFYSYSGFSEPVKKWTDLPAKRFSVAAHLASPYTQEIQRLVL